MLFLLDVLQIKNKQLYIAVGFCVICFTHSGGSWNIGKLTRPSFLLVTKTHSNYIRNTGLKCGILSLKMRTFTANIAEVLGDLELVIN